METEVEVEAEMEIETGTRTETETEEGIRTTGKTYCIISVKFALIISCNNTR